MDKFSIQNVKKLTLLTSELELEKASDLYLKLRVPSRKNESYNEIRKHLSQLITAYENKNWYSLDAISDKQIENSNLAEKLIYAQSHFVALRKNKIKVKLKENGLTQSDLAKILNHSKSYTSELINGLRPLSKEDCVVINRLFKIELDDLIPTFLKEEKVTHIRKTLDGIAGNKLRLSKTDIVLH